MIGGEDHEGVFAEAVLLKRVENAADLFVLKADESVVVTPHHLDCRGSTETPMARHTERSGASPMRRCGIPYPIAVQEASRTDR